MKRESEAFRACRKMINQNALPENIEQQIVELSEEFNAGETVESLMVALERRRRYQQK